LGVQQYNIYVGKVVAFSFFTQKQYCSCSHLKT
jgi:hypothetical protein